MLNKDILYNEQCFGHLNVNRMGGQLAPHKALLLLTIMDLVECKMIMLPQIELREALITAFKWNWVRQVPKEARLGAQGPELCAQHNEYRVPTRTLPICRDRP